MQDPTPWPYDYHYHQCGYYIHIWQVSLYCKVEGIMMTPVTLNLTEIAFSEVIHTYQTAIYAAQWTKLLFLEESCSVAMV